MILNWADRNTRIPRDVKIFEFRFQHGLVVNEFGGILRRRGEKRSRRVRRRQIGLVANCGVLSDIPEIVQG